MRKETLDRLIRVLSVLAALLVLALIVFAVIYFVRSQEEQSQIVAPAPTAQSETEGALTQSADFKPDRDRFFLSYDADLTDSSGAPVALSQLRGSTVVLLFWSSWCGDCKDYFDGAFPQAAAAAEALGAQVRLVLRKGLRDDDEQAAAACLLEHGITRESLMDQDAALYKEMGLRGVPSLAFLSGEGVLMYATDEQLSPADMELAVRYASGEAAAQSRAFIAQYLTESDGSIASAYTVSSGGSVIAQDDILSETHGLMLEYALRANDQTLFDKTYQFLRSSMTVSGLCVWRRTNGENAALNATLDDLRVVGALLSAQDKWGGYGQDIDLREMALYRSVVKDNVLIDFINLSTGAKASTATLCYLDLQTLERLANYRERWAVVYERAKGILTGGIISDAFPLYYPKYDVSSGTYTGTRLQMNEAMVTVLHAVRAGVASPKTLAYLTKLLKAGPVYAVYSHRGKPESGFEYESTATYALLAQIGLESGSAELRRLATARMEKERVFTAPLTGSYGLDANTPHYTFDVMQSLLTWSAEN